MKLTTAVVVLMALATQLVRAQTPDSMALRDQNPNHLRSKLKYVRPALKPAGESTVTSGPDSSHAVALPAASPATPDSDVEKQLAGLKAAEEKGDRASAAVALSAISAYYLEQNNLPAALFYYQKELKNNEARQDKKAALETLLHISNIYSRLKNADEAQLFYQRSLALARTLKDSEKMKLAGSALTGIYAARGNYKNAYEMSLLLKQVTDSLNRNETRQKLLQARLSYDSLKQVESSRVYQQDLFQKQFQVEKSRKITYLSIAALVLVLVLALVLYRGYKTTRQQKKEAEEKNEIIANSLKEKEILLKEIHHRVKNNLQIISSLLNLQAKALKDEDTKKIMSEARSRIASMALIHQKIYQSGSLGSVDLQTYVEQMVQSVEAMFSSKSRNISYYIDTHGISLDIDTSIPLGLIINELLTNIYKYAFAGREAGMIVITMETKTETELELKVSDNGVGLPPDFEAKAADSLGMKLIKGLANQIKGSVRFENKNGAHCFITIKKERSAK